MLNQIDASANKFFVITLHSSKRNSDLLDSEGKLRMDARRNIDYSIIPEHMWLECKDMYDKEIQIGDAYNVSISFSYNGITNKSVCVHGIEKIFDVIQTIFVNKTFSIDSFKQMFVVKCNGRIVDPMVNFEDLKEEDDKIVLIVERIVKSDDQVAVMETSSINENELKTFYEREMLEKVQADAFVSQKSPLDILEKYLKFYKRIYTVCDENKILFEKAASTSALNNLDFSMVEDSLKRNERRYTTQYKIDECGNTEAYALADMKNSRCVGIMNIGNSCYMNASIQCLNNCPFFSNFFVFYKNAFAHENYHIPFNELSENRDYKKYIKIISNWSKIVAECRHPNVISPRDLKNSIAEKNETFNNSKEQDSAEFIGSLLDYIHEGLSYNAKKLSDTSFCPNTSVQSSNAQFREFINAQRSIISELFYGMYTNVFKCSNCGHIKTKNDLLMILTLPIPNKIVYHSSSTLILLQARAPIKILIPLNITVEQAIEYTKLEYDIKHDLFFVEYCDGKIIEVPQGHKTIDSIKNSILIYEVRANKRYYLCSLYYTKLLFIKAKVPLDFLIEEGHFKNNLYEKFKPYFANDITPTNFFDSIKLKKGPFNSIMNLPTVEIQFKDIKCLFGDHFKLLSLHTSNKPDGVSLKDCLNYCFQEEMVESLCTNCNQSSAFSLKTSLTVLPKYLIIQFKRFAYNGGGTKINTFIDFPEDNFKINGETFRLIATTNHVEIGLGYGHYIAYIRKDALWYCCNDSLVSRVPGPDKASSYLLFYEKIG